MMFWDGSWGWAEWLATIVVIVGIWAVVIAGGIAFTRSPWNSGSTAQPPDDRESTPAHRG